MSPPPFRRDYPLNTTLVPGNMYRVQWEFRSSEVVLMKKPKKLGDDRRTSMYDIAGAVGTDNLVMYIETVFGLDAEGKDCHWYKLMKQDQMGYVKSNMIGLALVTEHDTETK